MAERRQTRRLLDIASAGLEGESGRLCYRPRRVFFRPRFRLLARIGSKGVAEDFLDPVVIRGKPVTTYWAEIKKTDRGGELFLYVNGPVLPLPWIADFPYRRHSGDAQIVIERESS